MIFACVIELNMELLLLVQFYALKNSSSVLCKPCFSLLLSLSCFPLLNTASELFDISTIIIKAATFSSKPPNNV